MAGARVSTDGWRRYAACADMDVNLFFFTDARSVRVAKGICGGCPVIDECLTEALDVEIPYGVFGGLDAEERQRLQQAWRLSRARPDRS